jgi:hypothetical protein
LHHLCIHFFGWIFYVLLCVFFLWSMGPSQGGEALNLPSSYPDAKKKFGLQISEYISCIQIFIAFKRVLPCRNNLYQRGMSQSQNRSTCNQ